ncbi:uncharacterized protein LOC114269606 [Camellia sinensis]|uniref:uncharacterized protein LOC114269606 n=1 Tax=Camellia sinensis TaxID=4442 RepID=UPI00103688DB|nr:uncharacterized protein LOC114269606 [Camellia sinensis]
MVPPTGVPQQPASEPMSFYRDPTAEERMHEIVQDLYGPGVKRLERPRFRKPYPQWVDDEPFPRSNRVPKFSLFHGEENQSIIEHIGRFTLQCGKAGNNDILKMRLFPHSLSRIAFTWFINLPADSIHTWVEMESKFHAQFYRTEPKSSRATRYESILREERHRNANSYGTYFQEVDVEIEIDVDVGQVSSRATRYESILREERHRNANSYGTYFQEVDVEIEIDVDVGQVVGKTPVICGTLRKLGKPVNMPANQPAKRNINPTFRQYSFDLSKADAIFDELLANKFLTLSPGHRIPKKDRVGKTYCKWHNTFRHSTNNCVNFRNCVQDLIQKGLLKYAENEKGVMAMDRNSFPEMAPIHMVLASIKKKTPNLTILVSDLERIHKEKQKKGKKVIDEDKFAWTRC